MAEKKKTEKKGQVAKGRIEAFAKKYEKAVKEYVGKEEKRLKLAQQLYELALQSDHSELHIEEHRADRPNARPKVRKYKLSDPEAALITMHRFCNVWFPAPLFLCVALGCPIIKPATTPPQTVCFLISCSVDVCTLANGNVIRIACGYLCV